MIEERISAYDQQSRDGILKIIGEVQQHPFNFGFRDAFLDKKGRIYTCDGGWTWRVNIQAPKCENDWYGNCVQDSLLSAAILRSQLPESTLVTIQHMYTKSLGNSPWGQDHFRVLVENPIGIMEYIDHSVFYTIWLHAGNTGIFNWSDLTPGDESEIKAQHEPEIDGKLVLIAYTEFDIRETRGVALVSLFHKDEDSEGFLITFDLIMPGLPVGDTDWRVYLDFEYGKIEKNMLMKKIRADELIYIRSHPALDEYTNENTTAAKRDFPPEIKESLQTWFKEIVDVLPSEIPDPHKK